MSEAAIMACATCHRVLDEATRSDGLHDFIHSAIADADHEPVPIPALDIVDELNLVCDFCGRGVAIPDVWTLPCETFAMPQVPIPDDPERNSIGDWMCCKVCAGLINEGRWQTLTQRALVAHGLPSDGMAYVGMAALYALVEVNAKGKAEHKLTAALNKPSS